MVKPWMHQRGSNLGEGEKDEGALFHQGVRNLKFTVVIDLITIEEDVDIDGAVVVGTVGTLGGASQVTLDGLGGVEQVQGGQGGLYLHGGIEERVVRLESPGGCFIKRGEGDDATYPLFYLVDGTMELRLLVTQIGAQT